MKSRLRTLRIGRMLMLPLAVLLLVPFQNCLQDLRKHSKKFTTGAPLTASDPLVLNLSDGATASRTFAQTRTVSVLIQGDPRRAKLCLSETQNLAPSAEGPCNGGTGPDQGWFGDIPESFELSEGEGVKRVYLWWTHERGVSGTSRDINLDTQPPTLSVPQPPAQFIGTRTLDLTYTAGDSGSGIASVDCRLDQGAFAPCAGGVYSPRDLTEGPHVFTLRVRDVAGHSQESSFSTMVDVTPPTLSATPSPPAANANQVTFTLSAADSGSGIDTSQTRCTFNGSTTTCSAGSFASPTLTNGNQTFTASVRDRAGNLRTLAAPITWTTNLDPASVALTLTQNSIASPNVSATAASFTFSSNPAAPSYRCRLAPVGGFAGTAFAACAPGTQVSYTGLPEGAKTFQVEGLNSGGTTIGTTSFSWTIDTTAPTLTVSPSAPSVTATQVSFTLTASDALSGIDSAQTQCTFDGTTSACPNATFMTPSLANQSSHSFTASVRDRAGNLRQLAAPITWTTNLDPASVMLAVTQSNVTTNGFSASATANFTFSSTPAAPSYRCRLAPTTGYAGTTFAACTPGTQVSYSALPDGSKTFVIEALNSGGTAITILTTPWTVDTTPPTLSVSPTAPAANAAMVTFTLAPADAGSGIDTAQTRCMLDTGNVTCPGDTFATGTLSNGTHTFNASARDRAGNTRTLAAPISWTTNLDPTSVTLAVTQSSVTPGGYSRTASADFTFSSTPAAPSYRCRLAPTTGYAGTPFAACAPGTQVSYTGLPEGPKTFQVDGLNSAGTVIGTNPAYSWTIDTVRPVLAWASVPTSPSRLRSPTLTFTSSEGSTHACSIDGAVVGCANGTIPLFNLGDGPHSVGVNTTDPAGNIATPISHQWVVDATAPVIAFVEPRPASPTNAASVSYSFSANEAGVTLYCARNLSSTFAPCPNPYAFAVNEGNETLQIYGLDPAGNQSAVIQHTVLVDRTAPALSLALSLGSPTNSSNLTISGSCSDATGIPAGVRICANREGVCSYPGDFVYTASCSNGAYSLPLITNSGNYAIQAAAADALGQTRFTNTINHEVQGTLYFSEILQSPTEHPDGRVPQLHDFETFIQIANDNAFLVQYDLYFYDANGVRTARQQDCAARSRCTFVTNGSLPTGYYGVEIAPRCPNGTCPKLYAHRSTYLKGFPDLNTGEAFFSTIWDASHDNNATTRPRTLFHFPEGGTTGWPTIYKIYNPQSTAVNVTLHLYALGVIGPVGNNPGDPQNGVTTNAGTQSFTIGPKRVFRLVLQDTTVMQNAAATYYKDFAASIDATAPVVIEQTLYEPPTVGAGGQSSVGEADPATEWYFPSNENFDMQPRVYIFNPNPVATDVLLYYWYASGLDVRGPFRLEAFSRRNFDLYYDGPAVVSKSPIGPGDTGLSVKSVVPGNAGAANTNAPIVVSKNLYWSPLTEQRGWIEGTQSFGSSRVHTAWLIPGGTCSGRQPGADNDRAFYHFVDILNSSGQPNTISITLQRTDGTTFTIPSFAMSGFNRRRIRIQDYGIVGDYYVKVLSTAGISVETTIMSDWDNNNNYQWRTGETSPAIPID